mmetsp:Transcript_27874/g.88988  ORF Transcript_27874/g.88988 Transcript_27874/m.88988 type:complete len:307 (+) Transcript_27874:48-968(+)
MAEAKKKVLVTGASGMTGRALLRELQGRGFEVVGCALSRAKGAVVKLDLLDGGAVAEAFAEIKPDAVVHCAAERRPDVSEKEKEFTTAINVTAAESLAKLCSGTGAAMVQLSTDYVFDGTQPPYAPAAAPHPLQFYGESKLQGERAVLAACPGSACVLRVPVLYAEDIESLDESATTVIASAVLSGRPAAVDDWGKRYPTNTKDLAACIGNLLEYHFGGAAAGGIGGKVFHFANNEVQFTKFTIAALIGEVLGVPTGHLTSDPNAPQGALRPRDTQLDTSALEALGLMPPLTPLREGLLAACSRFK